MQKSEALAQTLRPHYSRFLQCEKVLLTGHSHQAWPDLAEEGVLECFRDAAELADEKWGRAFAKADAVRAFVAQSLGAKTEEIALAANTHELLSRVLSSVMTPAKKHLVISKGEFHSARRQFSRLAEEGIEITWVDVSEFTTLAARMANAIREDTALVMISHVLFETSTTVPDLKNLAEHCSAKGVDLLVDAYHSFQCVPASLDDFGSNVFVVGGGYKYAQWGEGVCFLRVPTHREYRPVYTGWYSDFEHLSQSQTERVSYGKRPCDVFAGSTYDPTSHYRAERVIRFFQEQNLDIQTLRAVSLQKTEYLASKLSHMDLCVRDPSARGGFLAVKVQDADGCVKLLRDQGILSDSRGSILRLGPAPYTTIEELDRAVSVLRSL